MKISLKAIIFATLAIVASSCNAPTERTEVIGTMPEAENGYSLGVSACYAATNNGSLLLAGGCNFPDIPAAEGGKKRYYKGIYLTTGNSTLQWKKVGELPEASAYGVSLQYGNNLIIAGGMNEKSPSQAVNMLSCEGENIAIKQLPPLPCTIDNAAGAVSGNNIYIAGGNANGKASSRLFTLNINDRQTGWQELVPFPGNGRVQPVCAATDEALYLWGGFTPKDSLTEAKVHTDGYKYTFADKKWSALDTVTDENGAQLTLSGGTAIAYNDTLILAAGGVNRTIFEDAISGTYSCIPPKEYMKQAAEWYKFNGRLLAFDTKREQWHLVQKNQLYARAGALLTTDGEYIYYIGGELKPGIRTPEIVKSTVIPNK